VKLRAILLLLFCAVAHGADLDIRVTPVFGVSPIFLDSLRYQLPSGETVSISRLSMLLSGFSLQRQDGSWVDLPGQYAWLDAGTRRESVTLHDIPAGMYQAFRFAIGPEPAVNDGSATQYPATHPLNPNLNGLHWNWQGGYIFLAVEGSFRRALDPLSGFSYHFARDANRTFVSTPVPLRLDPAFPSAIMFDLDLATLFGSLSPARDGNSTHSRDGDPVTQIFRANLPSAFRLHGIAGVSTPPPAVAVRPLYLPASYTPYPLWISRSFPLPDLPADNPLLVERVQLGRRLFHERMLSRDGTLSCSSCHQPSSAFADSRRFSIGVEGQPGTRHAMPLLNLAWKSSFFWDGRAPSLRAQALMPIQDHLEMDENLGRVTARLAAGGQYPALFARAFDGPQITREKIGLAIENYLLTLTSCDSKFDESMRGQAQLTPLEQRGMALFFTEYDPRTGQYGADCFHCHGGALFTDHLFHNNGLGDPADPGRFKVTQDESDRGKFATPSLRNVALSGPYMHDGRFQTLDQVIDHYATGVQRSPTLDPNLARHPVTGLPLTPADKQALVAFLNTLTDPRLAGLGNPPPARQLGLR
jgi:cytochrome c peroxidase